MKTASLILGSFLICAALAYDWDGPDYEDNSPVAVSGGEKTQVPGTCLLCKMILRKVKEHISKNTTPDEIRGRLRAVCEHMGILRSACKGFVKRYIMVHINKLSTTEDVRTICVSVKACKPKELIYM